MNSKKINSKPIDSVDDDGFVDLSLTFVVEADELLSHCRQMSLESDYLNDSNIDSTKKQLLEESSKRIETIVRSVDSFFFNFFKNVGAKKLSSLLFYIVDKISRTKTFVRSIII
jgi:hypothetical protein